MTNKQDLIERLDDMVASPAISNKDKQAICEAIAALQEPDNSELVKEMEDLREWLFSEGDAAGAETCQKAITALQQSKPVQQEVERDD